LKGLAYNPSAFTEEDVDVYASHISAPGGQWIPEEQPQFVIGQLAKFFNEQQKAVRLMNRSIHLRYSAL
jgi:hypothetical protein